MLVCSFARTFHAAAGVENLQKSWCFHESKFCSSCLHLRWLPAPCSYAASVHSPLRKLRKGGSRTAPLARRWPVTFKTKYYLLLKFHACVQCILIVSTLTTFFHAPNTSPSQLYVHFFIIFIIYWLQLVLSTCSVTTIIWGMGNLPLATPLKNKWSSVPQQPSNPPIALQLGLGPLLPLRIFLSGTWSPPKIGRLQKHYQGQGSWCLPRDSLTRLHICFIKLGMTEEQRAKWF